MKWKPSGEVRLDPTKKYVIILDYNPTMEVLALYIRDESDSETELIIHDMKVEKLCDTFRNKVKIVMEGEDDD